MDKKAKQELLIEYKQETINKNKKLISKYEHDYKNNSLIECDLAKDNIYLEFCETKEQKQKWLSYVHMTTSLPYKGAVGRQIKIFVKCNDHILGMIHLTSPLAQMKVRDKYLNLENKWEDLKKIYNIETCVPTRKYANFLTGKLMIYVLYSNVVYEYIKSKYGDYPIGFETTSLYGKSSIYNRIPFFKYLGLTEGMSAVYIKDEEWKKILEEYYKVYPNTKTNRLAPVKFQIVDKLSSYYKKNKIDFPFEYKSEQFQRGVYFGYKFDCVLNEAVDNWRKRWYNKRKESIDNG